MLHMLVIYGSLPAETQIHGEPRFYISELSHSNHTDAFGVPVNVVKLLGLIGKAVFNQKLWGFLAFAGQKNVISTKMG